MGKNGTRDNGSFSRIAFHKMNNALLGQHDVIASFVLYGTAIDEVTQAVQQALNNEHNVYVVLVDNSVPPLNLPNYDAARVKLIRSGANLGYGRGHNLAIKWGQGRSRYHLVMNTDLTYGKGVIDVLTTFMDARLDVGLTMPKVLYPDGRIQRLCRLLPSPADLLGRRFFSWTGWAKRRNRLYEFHDWNYDRVGSFPFLSGCFMMMRRSVLDTVGGFDERYFLYAEDLDLSRRIHCCSETLFIPDVQVVHEYRSEGGRGIMRLLYGLRSLSQYFSKWGWFFDYERVAINQRTAAALQRHNDRD